MLLYGKQYRCCHSCSQRLIAVRILAQSDILPVLADEMAPMFGCAVIKMRAAQMLKQ